MRIFSGIQPTGKLHLGNYLGALRRFVDLQDTDADRLFCIVDLHAMTGRYDPRALSDMVRQTAAAFLAAGIDSDRSTIFVQSAVREHAELAWILTCTARLGWLERMTQFKDKAGAHAERESVGLYAYPVLMAADILMYRSSHVPVGADQRQHLELARMVADRFNKTVKQDVFVPPQSLIADTAARVMSLQDPTRKMSKSDPSDLGRIDLTDSADVIARKIGKAVTDSGDMPASIADLAERPGVRNLIELDAALNRVSIESALDALQGKRFSDLKRSLTERIVSEIVPIGERMTAILADRRSLDIVLAFGAHEAQRRAALTMNDVRAASGYR